MPHKIELIISFILCGIFMCRFIQFFQRKINMLQKIKTFNPFKRVSIGTFVSIMILLCLILCYGAYAEDSIESDPDQPVSTYDASQDTATSEDEEVTSREGILFKGLDAATEWAKALNARYKEFMADHSNKVTPEGNLDPTVSE